MEEQNGPRHGAKHELLAAQFPVGLNTKDRGGMLCPRQGPPFANLSPPLTCYHTCPGIALSVTHSSLLPTSVINVQPRGQQRRQSPVWISLRTKEKAFFLVMWSK